MHIQNRECEAGSGMQRGEWPGITKGWLRNVAILAVQARDDYANTVAAVQALRRPPLEAEDSQAKGLGKKMSGKGDKAAEEESEIGRAHV